MKLTKLFSISLATAAVLPLLYSPLAIAQEGEELDVIIVTASKREEALRDYAGGIGVLSSEALESSGAVDIEDYLGMVPGVQFSKDRPTSIRGIATEVRQTTTQLPLGFYFDDIPLSDTYSSIIIPSVDPFDLARIEFLKGPQGALYGSASIGGAINYVANKADPSEFSFKTRLGIDTVENGDTGHSVHAMVNMPVAEDKFAIRLVGGTTKESGYIDNIGTGENAENDRNINSFRGHATFTPTDAISFEAMFFHEKRELDGNHDEHAILGSPRTRTTAFSEASDAEVNLFSLKGEFDIGSTTLTSISAWTEKKADGISDMTGPIGGFLSFLLGAPFPLVESAGADEIKGVSQELRLASDNNGQFNWLIGAMYFEQEIDQVGNGIAPGLIDAIDAAFFPGAGDMFAPGNVWFGGTTLTDAKELAFFVDTTYEFSDRWELGVGGRYYKTEFAQDVTQFGFLVGPPVADGNASEDNGFNPKLTLRFRPSENTTLYGLASRGYRFGGVNLIPPMPGFETPESYDSDSIWNYEVGARMAFADGRADATIAVFNIDWTDVQVAVPRPDGFQFTDNIAEAESTGIEGSLSFVANDYFQFNLSAAYTDAKTGADYVGSTGPVPKGTDLPGTPELQTFASLRFNMAPNSDWQPFARLTHQHIGESLMTIAGTEEKGGYDVLNAQFGMSFGDVQVMLFGNNLSDERGILQIASFGFMSESTIKPRTVGLQISWAPQN